MLVNKLDNPPVAGLPNVPPNNDYRHSLFPHPPFPSFLIAQTSLHNWNWRGVEKLGPNTYTLSVKDLVSLEEGVGAVLHPYIYPSLALKPSLPRHKGGGHWAYIPCLFFLQVFRRNEYLPSWFPWKLGGDVGFNFFFFFFFFCAPTDEIFHTMAVFAPRKCRYPQTLKGGHCTVTTWWPLSLPGFRSVDKCIVCMCKLLFLRN